MPNIPVFRGKNRLIPGFEFLRNPFRFTIEQADRMGDFYRMPFFLRSIYVTANLDVIRHVLQANQKNYRKSPAYRNLRLAIGNGLVTSEGEFWKRQRRLAQPAFHKAQLEELFRSMVAVTERYCRDLRQKTQANQPLDVAKEMMSVTADIALKTLFSSDNQNDINEMYRVMTNAQDYIIHRTINPHLVPFAYLTGRHRRFRRDMKWFDQTIYRLIESHRNDPNPPADLLTMLLSARDEDTGEAMSDLQLRDEAITLFAAGHETSATALSWALFLLAQHPAVMQKLRQEIETQLGDRTPTFEDLRKLTYVNQVIQEAMRLYPPAHAVGREAIEADEIWGEKIPRKSIVFITIAALHRDPRFWEKPHEFYPEHFDNEVEKERPRLAYLPFGAGPRMCIGNNFAMMEMQLLLPMLVRQFDFELVEGQAVEPEPLVTLKPKGGILMKVKNRQAALKFEQTVAKI